MYLTKFHHLNNVKQLFLCLMLLSISSLVFAKPGKQNLIKQASGEELFNAIFLLEGEIVDAVPTLQQMRTQFQDDLANEVSISEKKELLERVSSVNPNYLSKLEKAVKSDNHNLISSTVTEGAQLIYITSVLQNSELTSRKNFPDLAHFDLNIKSEREAATERLSHFLQSEYGTDDVSALGLVKVIVILIGVVAVVAIVIAVAAWIIFGLQNPDYHEIAEEFIEGAGSLSNERLVNELVVGL